LPYCDHVLDLVVPDDGVENEVVGLTVEGVVPYSSVDGVPNVFVISLSASVYCELVGTV
jgi:hypothetical protein